MSWQLGVYCEFITFMKVGPNETPLSSSSSKARVPSAAWGDDTSTYYQHLVVMTFWSVINQESHHFPPQFHQTSAITKIAPSIALTFVGVVFGVMARLRFSLFFSSTCLPGLYVTSMSSRGEDMLSRNALRGWWTFLLMKEDLRKRRRNTSYTPTGSVLFTKSSDSLRHYMYWGWLIRIHCKEKTNNMWRFFGHINLDHFEIKKVANVKTVPNNVLKNCPTRGGTFYLCSWNRNRFAQCKNYFSNGSQTTVASYRSAHVQV